MINDASGKARLIRLTLENFVKGVDAKLVGSYPQIVKLASDGNVRKENAQNNPQRKHQHDHGRVDGNIRVGDVSEYLNEGQDDVDEWSQAEHDE